jgi:hypothetical protein
MQTQTDLMLHSFDRYRRPDGRRRRRLSIHLPLPSIFILYHTKCETISDRTLGNVITLSSIEVVEQQQDIASPAVLESSFQPSFVYRLRILILLFYCQIIPEDKILT